MISASTPPGTDVVCIEAGPGPYCNDTKLTKGSVYTIEQIVPSIDGCFCATLVGIEPPTGYHPAFGMVHIGFELHRFRYLDIPRSLTKLLETTPIEKTVRELEPT